MYTLYILYIYTCILVVIILLHTRPFPCYCGVVVVMPLSVILDGNSGHVAHACTEKSLLGENGSDF